MGGRTLTARPLITPPWTSPGVHIFTTQMDFLLVILPRFSRNIHSHARPHTYRHVHTRTHFFKGGKVFWVRQRTIKLGEKTRVPVWQSTQLQTTGYELCNKNSIKTNVSETEEEIDTGTSAVPNLQDMSKAAEHLQWQLDFICNNNNNLIFQLLTFEELLIQDMTV